MDCCSPATRNRARAKGLTYADNVIWMTVGITGVAVRMVGKLVYSTIDVIVSMTTKPTISEIIALLTLHLEELCFLMCMNTYTTICKRAAEGSSDDDGDNGNAPTNAPTNAASKATSKATSSTPARSGSISKMDSS
ncbi:hypothetical protein MRX96_018899 [Rhipicephalus microplus]